MSETSVKKSSYKKLFSNTVIFAIGSFSSKVLVLLLVKVYTNYLSREELGINDVITQIANWLQPIITMTISEAVIRFGLDKAFDKRKVFTLGNLVCAAGFAVLGLILPIVAISGVADKYLNGYSLLLYVYVVTSGLKLVYSTFVRALEKVRLFAFNGILTTLLTLIGTIVFMIGFKMGNTGYLLSIIVSDGLSVVFLTFAARLWRYFDFHNIDRRMLSTMLMYSIPLIPAQILWLITNSSDSFMTTHYLGPASNGVLSASYKIPNLVATVYFMFGQAWNMSAIIEDDSDDRNEFYTNVFELNQCLLYIIAAGCLMIVRPLTGIWFGPEYQDSALYSPLLIFSSVFSCFVTFLGSIYLTSRRTMRSLVTSMFSGIINIGLNIILIPRIGLYGPAVSTVVSYLTVFIIRAYDSRKIVPFDLKPIKIAVNCALLFLMVVINADTTVFSWLPLVGIFVLIFLMNYKPLWGAASKMLPLRIRKIVLRLGVYRCLALIAGVCVIIGLSVVTRGWLFYLGGTVILSVSLMLKKPRGTYAAVALIAVTAFAEHSAGAGAFVAAVLLTLLLLIYRRKSFLPVIVVLADVCIGSRFGLWTVTLVLCIEALLAAAVLRGRLVTGFKAFVQAIKDEDPSAPAEDL
ncbi:MAG: lipopolysaccharide biosynthesis protein [Ruminococcus sp.]|nr:lipopolysaccharide biosynthesis protein [Ruminococcus sp.]